MLASEAPSPRGGTMPRSLLQLTILKLTILGLAAAGPALAAPASYTIDSEHTYPSFEADHFGGMSVWRGKFNQNSGTIVLDREAKTGTVDIKIDAASIDFGIDKLANHVKGNEAGMLNVEKFPTATYKGKLTKF